MKKSIHFKIKSQFLTGERKRFWIRVESQVEDFSDVRKFSSFSYSDTRLNPGRSPRKVNHSLSISVDLKVTESVISSALPFIAIHFRFTTVPFKPLSGQRWGSWLKIECRSRDYMFEVTVYTVLSVLVYTSADSIVTLFPLLSYINKNI